MRHTKDLVKSVENSPLAPIRFVEGQIWQALINHTGTMNGAEGTSTSSESAPCMTLRRAIQIAAIALQNYTDKAGQPFILRALGVVDACSTDEERIVALLHEVVENSRWTLRDLRRKGVPDDVVDAVHALTLTPRKARADSVGRINRA